MPQATDVRAQEYRQRLLAALSEAISEEGYAGVTVADIVRRARVSKRTFYEQFDTKEESLLALYEAQTDRLLDAVRAAMESAPPGEQRVETGVRTYLETLQARPGQVRTLTLEILHLGERGLATRRRAMRRFADLVLPEIDRAHSGVERSEVLATALTGGVNELVLKAIEEDRVDGLAELTEAVTALYRPFLRADHSEAEAGANQRS